MLRFHPHIFHTWWDTGVCLSNSFVGASFFPDRSEDTWVYLLKNPSYFNIGRWIARILAKRDEINFTINQTNYLRDLAFEELTTPAVAKEKVMMGVRLSERHFENQAENWVVSYDVSTWVLNEECVEPEDRAFCLQLVNELRSHRHIVNTQNLSKQATTMLNKYSLNFG